MWKYEPADAALMTIDIFKTNKIINILIPGFGYGRNAKVFCDNGFKVSGIEISKSAIDIAYANGLNCKIFHGSVVDMPFDNEQYDGIFCYALIHLLNKNERKHFLSSCYTQLNPGGMMIFVVTSKQMSIYGNGKALSKDRYEISKGLKVYFYDEESVIKEFAYFGLIENKDIEEPVKFMDGQEPLKLKYIICKKK
jgi:SAM-dependent methyltransferase